MNKLKTTVILMLSCILMSGCWDKVDIDRKMFISTIGVDLGKDISKEEELRNMKPSDPFAEREIKKLNITFGFPNISELGPGKGSTVEDKFVNTDAASMQDAISRAVAKSSRDIHLGHSKLLLLSNSLMENKEIMKETMDYFQREPRINRSMLIAVAQGNAENYVKFSPNMEKNIESYITGVMENSGSNSTVLPVTLNEFLTYLNKNGNAVIPNIKLDKDKKELVLSGTGVIKDYTLKGILTPLETSDLEILRGKLKGGKKVIYIEGHPLDVVIDGIERKIKFKKDQDKYVFNIEINLEGRAIGYHLDKKLSSSAALKEAENNFSKALSEECEKVVQLTQKKFDVDAIGLNDYLEKYKPSTWDEVKDNWDEVYKNLIVNVDVQTRIRRIGVTE